jgi:hypothetical protein
MIHAHSSTVSQRVQWVSQFIAREGSYGVVSQMSRTYQVSRQTLSSWEAKGQRALEAVFTPPKAQAGMNPSVEEEALVD